MLSFLLPRCFDILIYSLIQTIDQGTGQVGASLSRKGHGFFSSSSISGDIGKILRLPCVLVRHSIFMPKPLPCQKRLGEVARDQYEESPAGCRE